MHIAILIVLGIGLLGLCFFCKVRFGRIVSLSHGNGHRTTAKVVGKPGKAGNAHSLLVQFETLASKESRALVYVSPATYDKAKEGDELDLIYNDARIEQCAVVTGRRSSDGVLFVDDFYMPYYQLGVYAGGIGGLLVLAVAAAALYGII